jgi:hypothetical protein
MSIDSHPNSCPLANVDQRLEDVHQQWHQAEAAYFDPDRFRLSIQTVIQTLRTVTWVLQNRKKIIPNFDLWYGGWQERLRADALMRWMIDARNKIQKQGDLEAHSLVRAEIVASYLDEGPRVEVSARLFDAPLALVKSIPNNVLGEHMRAHGILKIQRRWVENTLPDYELLDAVAIAYGRISHLVRDAHRQLGLQQPLTTNVETGEKFGEGARSGRLPCMIGHADLRSFNFSLADGSLVRLEKISKTVDLSEAQTAAKRYALRPETVFGPVTTTEEAIGANLFRTARTMFLKDGYHRSILFLFRERRPVQILEMRSENQGQKYLIMRDVAHEVTKYGADAVIVISEVWTSPFDPRKPYQRAADSPVREEALLATLATKSGDPIEWVAKICRNGRTLSLGETRVERDGLAFSFAPIYEAWGRAVPDYWIRKVEYMLGKPRCS